jgi:hypothetical protein
MRHKPTREFLRATSTSGIERSQFVEADPVDVSPAVLKVLRGLTLAAMARTPECSGNFFLRWTLGLHERVLHLFE